MINETRDLAPFLVNLKACSDMFIFYYILFIYALFKKVWDVVPGTNITITK